MFIAHRSRLIPASEVRASIKPILQMVTLSHGWSGSYWFQGWEERGGGRQAGCRPTSSAPHCTASAALLSAAGVTCMGPKCSHERSTGQGSPRPGGSETGSRHRMGRGLRIPGQRRPSSANTEGTGVCVISGHRQGEAEPELLLREDDSREVTLWGKRHYGFLSFYCRAGPALTRLTTVPASSSTLNACVYVGVR